MEKLRFIDLETHNAAENMAIDEAIMLSLERGDVPPTLRLYRWRPSAVSIGTFQSVKNDGNLSFCFLLSMKTEVDLDFCRTHGIDVVRRLTGGSAVYHDSDGEITYSIILPKGHRLAPMDIEESYTVISEGILRSLKHLGLDAELKQVSDVQVNGKKICGSAQTRKHECLLQHGSVLLGLDEATIFSILRMPPPRAGDRITREVHENMTSVRYLLRRQVGFDELRAALVTGFSEALSVDLVPARLTQDEKKRALELATSKYETETWNFGR